MAGFFRRARKGRNDTEEPAGQVAGAPQAGSAQLEAFQAGPSQPAAFGAPGAFGAPDGSGSPQAPGSMPAPAGGSEVTIDSETYYRLDLPHGFSQPMNVGVPGEEVRYLTYPAVPEGLPEGAEEYAQSWWQIWGTMLGGHIDVARAGEAGNIPQAEQLLFNWEEAVKNAGDAAWRFQDFQGGRTLVLASDEVSTCYLEVIDALHDYLRVRAGGGNTAETIEDTHIAIGNLHIELNRSVATFFADPLRTIAPNEEPEGYAGPAGQEGYAGPAGQEGYGVAPDPAVPGPAVPGPAVPDPAAVPGAGQAATAEGAGQPSGEAVPEQRLSSDVDFYIEVLAAATAVTEAGGDARGYLEQGYGVTLAQLTAASAAWVDDVALQDRIPRERRLRADQIYQQITGYPRATEPGTLPNGVEDLAADIDM